MLVDALSVKPRVDGVSAALTRVKLTPELAEPVVVRPAAERARPMPGGEGGRLVEEEELGELSRLEQRAAVPPLELEATGDPATAVPAPADAPVPVVQAAAVAVDGTALGRRDELAER